MLKKMMLTGLMTATVLGGIAPAYAQRGQDSAWRVRGDNRSEAPDRGRSGGDTQRQQRGQDGGRGDGMRERPQVQQQAQRWEQRRNDGPAVQQSWRDQARTAEQTRTERPQWRDDRRDDRRSDWRDGQRRDDRRADQWRDNQRGDWQRRDWRGDNSDRRWSGSTRRFDDRTRWSGQRRWDGGWRQDRRYDWSSYRSRYGDRYRLGRYYAPRGWSYGYSRFSVGFFLSSLLYADSYWIDDPWQYRLPPAYGTLRWIRYYDDALLVDIRDGYVVDVIHDFFW